MFLNYKPLTIYFILNGFRFLEHFLWHNVNFSNMNNLTKVYALTTYMHTQNLTETTTTLLQIQSTTVRRFKDFQHFFVGFCSITAFFSLNFHIFCSFTLFFDVYCCFELKNIRCLLIFLLQSCISGKNNQNFFQIIKYYYFNLNNLL